MTGIPIIGIKRLKIKIGAQQAILKGDTFLETCLKTIIFGIYVAFLGCESLYHRETNGVWTRPHIILVLEVNEIYLS